jgi:ligand-binding SRPBCC domain-containing protein
MQTITVETEIAAPLERCFLLSLSIDLHVESTAQTGERAIAGVTRGLIGPGETVTWQGRHFGLMLRHETRITQYDRPGHFQDAMVKGAFRSFVHDHFFEARGLGGTLMRDELRFAAPLGPLGWVAETLVLRDYLRRFLMERNEVIRRTAEGEPEVWQRYLGSACLPAAF